MPGEDALLKVRADVEAFAAEQLGGVAKAKEALATAGDDQGTSGGSSNAYTIAPLDGLMSGMGVAAKNRGTGIKALAGVFGSKHTKHRLFVLDKGVLSWNYLDGKHAGQEAGSKVLLSDVKSVRYKTTQEEILHETPYGVELQFEERKLAVGFDEKLDYVKWCAALSVAQVLCKVQRKTICGPPSTLAPTGTLDTELDDAEETFTNDVGGDEDCIGDVPLVGHDAGLSTAGGGGGYASAPAPGASSSWTIGQTVEYWSGSQNKWLKCKVKSLDASGGLEVDVKPGYWMSKAEQKEKVRAEEAMPVGTMPIGTLPGGAPPPPPPALFKDGQDVEYNSVSQGKWIACKVTSVDAEGRVQVNVKPGYWMSRVEQLKGLRAMGVAAAAEEGIDDEDDDIFTNDVGDDAS